MRVTEWIESDSGLCKEFAFPSFAEAIWFVNRVAEIADEVQHHPHVLVQYNRVKLFLTTHDAGNQVTQKDHRLAERIDRI